LWATAVSPDGRFRVEVRTGRQTTLLHVDSGWRLDLSAHGITCLSFSPDSRLFATGHNDSQVRLWDCETGGLLMALKGSSAPITTVHVDPSGSSVAAGSRDGRLLVWELATGEQLVQLPVQAAQISNLRWSKRGDRLAVVLGDWLDRDRAALLIWSPQERVILSQQSLANPAGAVEWLGQDEALIIADWNGQSSIWNLATGEKPVNQLTLPKDRVSAAAWSPDCPLIADWQTDQFVFGAP
jgi:WD40 repeat protein